jgi:hypothetical protein
MTQLEAQPATVLFAIRQNYYIHSVPGCTNEGDAIDYCVNPNCGTPVLVRFRIGGFGLFQAADPVTFALVAGVLIAVLPAACLVPAQRAAKADPIVALR